MHQPNTIISFGVASQQRGSIFLHSSSLRTTLLQQRPAVNCPCLMLMMMVCAVGTESRSKRKYGTGQQFLLMTIKKARGAIIQFGIFG